MSEANKKMSYRWFEEVWNNKNESVIDEMLTEETIHHGLGGTEILEIHGLSNFKEFYRAFINAFPDVRVEVLDCIAEGDKVAVHCEVTGTHSGDGLGFAATNREVKFTGLGFCIIRDGKFVEVWNNFDFLRMYYQIDALSLKL